MGKKVQDQQYATDAHKALVLNASWQPIETVSWQNAFKMILNGRAKAIDYYDAIVRTPNDEFFIPAVLVLTEYNAVPKRTIIYSKRLVYERDKWKCQYCSKQLSSKTATIDHVLPRSRGGRSNFENCVASCEPCNSTKANKLLRNTRFKLLKRPKKPYLHPLQGKIGTMKEEWEPYIGSFVVANIERGRHV